MFEGAPNGYTFAPLHARPRPGSLILWAAQIVALDRDRRARRCSGAAGGHQWWSRSAALWPAGFLLASQHAAVRARR
jgi:hypothetical protein